MSLSAAQLKSEWRRVYKAAPPAAYTTDLLIRGIAYRLQEKALGGLSAEARRELDRLSPIGSDGLKPKPGAGVKRRPGNRLVRRWRGSTFTVTVEERGFLFQGRSYGSLTMIATEITGTRCSGPRFFGLTERAA